MSLPIKSHHNWHAINLRTVPIINRKYYLNNTQTYAINKYVWNHDIRIYYLNKKGNKLHPNIQFRIVTNVRISRPSVVGISLVENDAVGIRHTVHVEVIPYDCVCITHILWKINKLKYKISPMVLIAYDWDHGVSINNVSPGGEGFFHYWKYTF